MIGITIIFIFFLVIFTSIVWAVTKLFEKAELGFIIVGISFLIMLGAIAYQFEGYSIDGGSTTAGLEFLSELFIRKAFLILGIIQFITSLLALNKKVNKQDKLNQGLENKEIENKNQVKDSSAPVNICSTSEKKDERNTKN